MNVSTVIVHARGEFPVEERAVVAATACVKAGKALASAASRGYDERVRARSLSRGGDDGDGLVGVDGWRASGHAEAAVDVLVGVEEAGRWSERRVGKSSKELEDVKPERLKVLEETVRGLTRPLILVNTSEDAAFSKRLRHRETLA